MIGVGRRYQKGSASHPKTHQAVTVITLSGCRVWPQERILSFVARYIAEELYHGYAVDPDDPSSLLSPDGACARTSVIPMNIMKERIESGLNFTAPRDYAESWLAVEFNRIEAERKAASSASDAKSAAVDIGAIYFLPCGNHWTEHSSGNLARIVTVCTSCNVADPNDQGDVEDEDEAEEEAEEDEVIEEDEVEAEHEEEEAEDEEDDDDEDSDFLSKDASNDSAADAAEELESLLGLPIEGNASAVPSYAEPSASVPDATDDSSGNSRPKRNRKQYVPYTWPEPERKNKMACRICQKPYKNRKCLEKHEKQCADDGGTDD